MLLRRFLLIALSFAIAAATIWYFFTNAAPFQLDASQLAAYRINPDNRQRGGGSEFHHWEVLETRPAVPQAARQELIRVLQSHSTYGLEAYKCFDPGMAFSFGGGTNRVDVLICLHCRRARFYRGDGVVYKVLSDSGVERLVKIYHDLFGPDPVPASAPTE